MNTQRLPVPQVAPGLAALVVAALALLGGARVAGALPAAPATTPTPSATPVPAATPWVLSGQLGKFVPVADACSYYPFRTCDGVELQVSEPADASLKAYENRFVRLTLEQRVCGSSIAGRPLYGPVAVQVEPAADCGADAPQVCPFARLRAPDPAIHDALANPEKVLGWSQSCNPSILPGPTNGRRTWLSLLAISKPYHPLYNPLIYKCGCP